MKVSIVTVVLNRVETVGDAIRSVQAQDYPGIEHIIVDGASTDGTLEVARALSTENTKLLSQPDNGIYFALNKGIEMAEGDVVGLMHSDDLFESCGVVGSIVDRLNETGADGVYGDLVYVSASNPDRIIRRWIAGPYREERLGWGWMPPHPTLFLRRTVFERWGAFDTRYRIAADYDAVLRYLKTARIRLVYVPEVLVRMRLGGASNGSLRRIFRKSVEDYRALKENGVGGWPTLLMKNATKLPQFFRR